MRSIEWWHCRWPWVTLKCPKVPHFLHFAPPFMTSNLVHWLTIASPTLPMKNIPWKGRGQGQANRFYNFTPRVISPQRLMLQTSNFVHGSAMRSLSLVMNECSLSGRGQGHVTNFCIVDFKKFRHSKLSVYRWYTQLDRRRFVYDTLPPTRPPTSYHRFGQDLSYK